MKKEISIVLLAVAFFCSCKQDKADPDLRAYPQEIAQILVTKCATSGCHNASSYQAAGGLNLSSWQTLFEGGNSSACVIPYRSDFSTLCYFTNTDPQKGPTLSPTMPLNESPLTATQYETLRKWIEAGAPDINGYVKFSENPARKKIYVVNQGCRVVTVVDQQTLLPMRYITVGSGNETPHQVKLSPDKQFWYIVSIGGNSIKKFRTADDQLVGEVSIPTGNYNTMAFTPDSKKVFIVDFSTVGTIVEVDVENMGNVVTHSTSDWTNIHGVCMSPDGTTLYVTSQYQNRIFKIPLSDFSLYSEIKLNAAFSSQAAGITDPHEIIFSPDGSKYFVTCMSSDEVRVFDTNTDTLISSIAVGTFPLEFSLSLSQPYLFVSCESDLSHLNAPVAGKKGVISVINYNTNLLVQHIDGGFYQPHGLAVDDDKGLLYVASRNLETAGPAPHHSNNCGGRNGYITYIDLNTLSKTGRKTEVSTDAYSVTVRN